MYIYVVKITKDWFESTNCINRNGLRIIKNTTRYRSYFFFELSYVKYGPLLTNAAFYFK